MTETITQATLTPRPKISTPTYAQTVVKGLTELLNQVNPQEIDRHITMPIPNSLATQPGTEANTFLKRAGEVGRTPEAGVHVTLEQGQTFKNKVTGEEETILLIDFELTPHTNVQKVQDILSR